MSKATITPYVFFAGRCDEAIAFYREALGAEVEILMRFSESPDPVPEGMLEPGFENKVMHATIRILGAQLMVSDGCDSKSACNGFKLALSLPTEADAQRAFAALSQEGRVEMPLTKTFWSPCFGMLTDRFNMEWMVSVATSSPN